MRYPLRQHLEYAIPNQHIPSAAFIVGHNGHLTNLDGHTINLCFDVLEGEAELTFHVILLCVCVTLVEWLTSYVRFENFLDTLRDLQLKTIGNLKGQTLVLTLIDDITITIINNSCDPENKHVTLLVG